MIRRILSALGWIAAPTIGGQALSFWLTREDRRRGYGA